MQLSKAWVTCRTTTYGSEISRTQSVRAPSDLIEAKVLECVQEGVMPVEDQLELGNGPAPLDNQMYDLLEVGLAYWHCVRVDVVGFKFTEKQFCYGCIKTVGARHGYWHSQPLQHLHCCFRLVVRCSVPLYDS